MILGSKQNLANLKQTLHIPESHDGARYALFDWPLRFTSGDPTDII